MADDGARRRNRLANETSPYLLQHADNPVDWFPWGDEAFERARTEDKPILLSVGYSSCHWCHVMAHESFEDESVARLMNEGFVNIKVDREERPDVDSVYMTVTQAMTGSGGWPMTVFLTPEGDPFYAGTYFPPEDGHGRPGFRTLLEAVRGSWEKERERLVTSAADITSRLRQATEHSARNDAPLDPALPAQAVAQLRERFDTRWGGFGGAPKFPSPSNLEFLLMHHARTSSTGDGMSAALEMVLLTLRRMAEGGIYDHLGGGFSRYSVDERWLVPHFEKMLYDNAQLVRLYLHAYQITRDSFFERIARETLAYLEREMLDTEGGFYSAQDADSEGIEGKYFVWTPAEIAEVLGEDDARVVCAAYAVTETGNFSDPHHPGFGRRNVLSTPRPLAEVAADLGIDPADLEARLGPMRAQLLEAREQRVHPGLDDKVLTSWNGLALAAFAEAGRILDDEHYVAIGLTNAASLRDRLWQDGRVLHTYKAGAARVEGLLEDYVYFGLGLVELYRATGGLEHLRFAAELLERTIERFRDEERGGFFETPESAEALILRPKSFFDAATPSGNGAAALLAFWLGRYFERPDWEALASEVVALVRDQLLQAPGGFGSIWQVAELLLAARHEVVIVGAPDARAPLEREVARRYLPSVVLAPSNEGEGLPVIEDRAPVDGAAAHICENMVCQLPVSTPEALRKQLEAL